MYKYFLLVFVAVAAVTMLALMAVTLEPQRESALGSPQSAPMQTGTTGSKRFNPTPWV